MIRVYFSGPGDPAYRYSNERDDDAADDAEAAATEAFEDRIHEPKEST